MANVDVAKAMFSQADTNQDGIVDRDEFRNWASNATGSTPSTHEILTGGVTYNSDNNAKTGINRNETSSQSAFEYTSGFSTSNSAAAAAAAAALRERTSSTTVQTNNAQETNEYLSRSANGVYNDPNPEIIRRAATEGPLTYQQKILIRFLQPPPVPPPGPLIIKEIRPPQPPPPPPLVVRQRAPPLPSLPPLILRERPPIPPIATASQTIIRHLNAVPVPPRSVIVERLPPLPPKPREIIIERWIPYGPQAKRRTIVQRAPPPVRYPQPRNIIISYDPVQTRIVRQFQRLGVTQQDPQAYVAQYGTTLLDSATLTRLARTAGVVEDISPPTSSSSFNINTEGTSANYEYSNITNGQGLSSSSSTTGFEGLQVVGDTEPNIYNLETRNNNNHASYSSSNFASNSLLNGNVGINNNTALDVAAASFGAADVNHDGRLDRAEFIRFIQGGV
ncbi:unnamed protein product [Adineta steineri]|uniref:EF-hand domain-containing protein n=1 Tax=Adineta steineri TaxID=433720 RepID=A0A813M970_9BILA|nr:unnamed protein product [Adineta steineri]